MKHFLKRNWFLIILCLIAFFSAISEVKAYAQVENLFNTGINTSNYEAVFDELVDHFDVGSLNANGKTFDTMKSEWISASRKNFTYYYQNYGNAYEKVFWYGAGVAPSAPTNTNLDYKPSYYYHQQSWRGAAYQAYFSYNSNGYSPNAPDVLYYCCYIDEAGYIWEYSSDSYSVVDSLGPQVDFDLYNDGMISVFYNGASGDFYRFNLSRSVNSWALGHLDGLDVSLKFDFKLYRFMNSEFTTPVSHFKWYNGVSQYDGGLSCNVDGVLYINNTSLYYNQGYYLTIDVDGVTKFSYPVYFVPFNYSSSSGDLLSPLIDTNSDLEILNNIQDLVNIVNLDAVVSSYLSGESIISGDFSLSGELYNLLGYTDYDNDYRDYIYNTIYTSLSNMLTSSGDVSFNFNYMGQNIILRSSNFTVPDGPLKFFVTSFLVFATIYYFYITIIHFFHKLQEFNLYGSVETWGVDDESILM